MNNLILVATAVRAIRKHKGRSILTILSIIVGIAAIICTLAIGYGAEEKIKRKIQAMGKNIIFVNAGNWMQQGKTKATKRKQTRYLRAKDLEAIQLQIPGIRSASGGVTRSLIVKYRGSSIMSQIKGHNEHILDIVQRKISRGMGLLAAHIRNSSYVAVLGSKAARELFGLSNPLEKTILIDNKPFTVIGIMSEEKNFLGQRDPNLDILVPVSTMRKAFAQRSRDRVDGIALRAESPEQMSAVVRGIRKTLRARHKLEKNDPDDFMIFDQKSMTKAAQESSNTLTLFLLIIASISLLVGGIGVMNIMLVSVTERTKEIGIRMALGATSSLIRRQFVLEAITLCTFGGIIGTALGLVLPYIAAIFTGWLVIHKVHVVALAVFITTLIGIFFGFYPAYKASKLNPVQALTDR